MLAASRASGRRKNWISFDLNEYRLAAVSRCVEALAADAATQTDESRGDRHGRNAAPPKREAVRMELGINEISSLPSSSRTRLEHDERLARH
jgi:hypothetical protein